MSKRQDTYKENKAKKVGEECSCPICGSTFVKRQWQQAFCCAYCKEKFWNDKPDRHRAYYHRDYNKKHPKRLERVGLSVGHDVWLHPFSSEALGQW